MAIERDASIVFENQEAARQFLNEHVVDEIADARGKVLFDRNDVERCIQFQQTLKDRFAKELTILDPNGLGSIKGNPQQ